jgi:hypothetical protein
MIGRSIGATKAALRRLFIGRRIVGRNAATLWLVFFQFCKQHLRRLPRVIQPSRCDLPDRFEVKTVLQPRFPVSVLLALFGPLCKLRDAVALAGELNHLIEKSDDPEVFQV